MVWAAYANDTASFTGTGFTEKLFVAYERGKIRGIIPLENGTAGEDRLLYRNAKELEHLLAPGADTLYTGEAMEIQTKTAKLSERFANAVFELYRILYIRNGILRSYITRISPKTTLVTSNGIALGLLESVSFAVNKKYRAKLRSAGKMNYLGKITSTFVADSIPAQQRLKETFGRNIIETLWPHVISGKISVYAGTGKEKITPAQLSAGNYPGAELIQVPVYDSTGDLIGNRSMYYELNAGSFDKISITEEIYYDVKRNIVLSKIPELLLYKKLFGPNSVDMQPIRLVF